MANAKKRMKAKKEKNDGERERMREKDGNEEDKQQNLVHTTSLDVHQIYPSLHFHIFLSFTHSHFSVIPPLLSLTSP